MAHEQERAALEERAAKERLENDSSKSGTTFPVIHTCTLENSALGDASQTFEVRMEAPSGFSE
jgi:hypothetical protein